jgi:thioredoxin-related protein
MRKLFGFSLLVLFVLSLTSFRPPHTQSSRPPHKEKIVWLSLSELQTAYAMQRRPIIIDVYTSWCGWCKVMDKETYSNEKVISYINKNFYAVRFNAETTDTVMLASKKYGYNAANNANDLAVYLLGGHMGYPTTVLLSSINAQPAPLAGYLKPSELEPPLKYFGEGSYKKLDFPEFMKGFAGTW